MILDNLNPSQQEAVKNTDGAIMVLAGAGSGKTRTLVTRIQYLLEELGISPYRILAVTFSNKAAREMKERVAHTSNVDLGALQITTFHAFCAKLLRFEATYLGLSRNFTIYDDSETLSVIKAIMAKKDISQKEVSPYEIAQYFDQLKNAGFYLGRQTQYEFEDDQIAKLKDHEFFNLFADYEEELAKSNAVDFGGLITGIVKLFECFPEVVTRYQQKFEYILVDEYQDTNRVQFILIYLLSKLKKNICVVGDEDQSIYSWRGADIRNILDFEQVFPNVKVIKLEQNYRSSKTIIDAATAVISQNKMRKGKSMWTDNTGGDAIQIVECLDDRSEAEYVVEKISHLVKQSVDLQDIAIFYRNNSQSRQLEDALRKQKIAYRIVAGIKFYDRKEIKDLLSYLRIVVNPKDSLAMARIINVPTRGVGTTSLRKIEDLAVENGLSLWEQIEQIVSNSENYKDLRLSSKIKSELNQFVNLIQECQLLNSKNTSPIEIYNKLLQESGYYQFIKSQKNYESLSRLDNLEELATALKQFEELDKQPTLAGFLETITLDAQVEQEQSGGMVSLMTVHGSKGLEYPYVYLIGTEETLFPSYRSIEAGEAAIEEERRLFYVAMTRAMKELHIVYARSRLLWGSVKYNGPSRFIDEIPSEYTEQISFNLKKAHFTGGSQVKNGIDYDQEYSQEYFYDDSVSNKVSVKVSAKFPRGAKIYHKLYGEGLVLESEGSGNDEKVVIKFRDGAQKKFMVKYSPLEII
jgi:DNA helicase II / ATP-dependent DNA helicase PcrA